MDGHMVVTDVSGNAVEPDVKLEGDQQVPDVHFPRSLPLCLALTVDIRKPIGTDSWGLSPCASQSQETGYKICNTGSRPPF